MSKLYRSGCCHKCGSPACGGACTGVAKVAPVVEASPANKLDCDLTLSLPQPKLPEKLSVEICCDQGDWFCCTLPTAIAAVLLSANIARVPNGSSAPETTDFDVEAFFNECGINSLFNN